MITGPTPSQFRPYTRQTIFLARQWQWMSAPQQEAVQVMSHVLPFRTNQFVLDQLIDWRNIPDDPIFRLTFPQRDMLPAQEYAQLRELVLFNKNAAAIAAMARGIRTRMHTHPATHDVAGTDNMAPRGLQHRYEKTVQFFPGGAQACPAACTCCGSLTRYTSQDAIKLDRRALAALVAYLRGHPSVHDVLITGGDPLAMPAGALAECIDPLLAPELEHIRSIRIGTRSLAWWPHRFVTDSDSGDLLRLFARIAASGKRLSIMGHYNHPVELRNPVAQRAVQQIVASGASLRMQGRVMRHVNDDPASWAELWATGMRLGAIPQDMFVERGSGLPGHFAMPLARALEVFQVACQAVPGLKGLVNGPSMSLAAGKMAIEGITRINGEKLFALQFLAARNEDWAHRPFFARFDPGATWLDQLVPAFGCKRFFFESADAGAAWGGNVVPLVPPARRDARAPDVRLELA